MLSQATKICDLFLICITSSDIFIYLYFQVLLLFFFLLYKSVHFDFFFFTADFFPTTLSFGVALQICYYT